MLALGSVERSRGAGAQWDMDMEKQRNSGMPESENDRGQATRAIEHLSSDMKFENHVDPGIHTDQTALRTRPDALLYGVVSRASSVASGTEYGVLEYSSTTSIYSITDQWGHH